jgi:hypothetical protein
MKFWAAWRRRDRNEACGRFNAVVSRTAPVDRMPRLGGTRDRPSRRSAQELSPGDGDLRVIVRGIDAHRRKQSARSRGFLAGVGHCGHTTGSRLRTAAFERALHVLPLERRNQRHARNCLSKQGGGPKDQRPGRYGARGDDVGRRESFGRKSRPRNQAFRIRFGLIDVGLALPRRAILVSSQQPFARWDGSLSDVKGAA